MENQYFQGEIDCNKVLEGFSPIHLINYFISTWPAEQRYLITTRNDKMIDRIYEDFVYIAQDTMEGAESMPLMIRGKDDTLQIMALIDSDGMCFKFDFRNKKVSWDLFTNEPQVLKLMELCGKTIK